MDYPVSISPERERNLAPDLNILFADTEIPAESRFLQWLTRLPLSADVPSAARLALHALDRVAEPTSEIRRLRAFFAQVTAPVPAIPRRRTRLRH